MKNKIQFKVCGQGDNTDAYHEIEELIIKLQKIMRLQDWDIDLAFLSANEISGHMGSDGYSAFCETWCDAKRAIIYVNIEREEVNKTIVGDVIHEMCHILSNAYERQVRILCDIAGNKYANKTLDVLLEQMVDGFAQSIENALSRKESQTP